MNRKDLARIAGIAQPNLMRSRKRREFIEAMGTRNEDGTYSYTKREVNAFAKRFGKEEK